MYDVCVCVCHVGISEFMGVPKPGEDWWYVEPWEQGQEVGPWKRLGQSSTSSTVGSDTESAFIPQARSRHRCGNIYLCMDRVPNGTKAEVTGK